MKILIVEDNYSMRNFLKQILTGWGHSTLEAENGVEGVKSFIKNNPDVVLLDIQMEGMDGIEAAEIIRKQSSQTKIIIVTNYNDKPLREKAKLAGADDYFLKENLLGLKEILIK